MKAFLTGNEAIARGAYEAGVRVCTAYPGTPSTEIMENLKKYDDIYVEWSTNEKVAVDVAAGASMVGVRAMSSMKHQGINVAADTFHQLPYLGVVGGLVFVSCDDVGCHSSNNEQDNRQYAKFAQIPMLEPSDSQEAKDFTKIAFQISEEMDTPVLLRMTTRVDHSSGIVEFSDERLIKECPGFNKDVVKFAMVGVISLNKHHQDIKRRVAWVQYSDKSPMNKIEWGDTDIGIITSGISYQYVKEVLPDASILKLGMTFPLPKGKIREFASKVNNIYVVEEGEPFLEEQVSAMGIAVTGKDIFPRAGEFSPDIVAKGLSKAIPKESHAEFWKKLQGPDESIVELEQKAIPRPPVLCPGCPHRATLSLLKKLPVIVMGDIGCYGLGVFPPLKALHGAVVMGSSIGTAIGISKGLSDDKKEPVIAVIGDSTFLHSGMTPLSDAVFNKADITVIIVDNRTTALTGFQPHPASGFTIRGEKTTALALETLCEALGVERVRIVDPVEQKSFRQAIEEEIDFSGVSVIIARRPCALITPKEEPYYVVEEKCIGCGKCLEVFCPAISSYDSTITVKGKAKEVKKALIDETICTGCALCFNLCKPKAIERKAA